MIIKVPDKKVLIDEYISESGTPIKHYKVMTWKEQEIEEKDQAKDRTFGYELYFNRETK